MEFLIDYRYILSAVLLNNSSFRFLFDGVYIFLRIIENYS